MNFHRNKLKNILHFLYEDGSKHSNYQNIPIFVQKELNYKELINEKWRGDTARYKFIKDNLYLKDGYIVGDLGANIGFFSLSLAKEYPQVKFVAYEANQKHCQFIEEIKSYFKISNIFVENISINSTNIGSLPKHDVMFHLNVLHHAGFDFDNGVINNIREFSSYAISHLTTLLKAKNNKIYFQIGSNWGGNKDKPIVNTNDDISKVLYISNLCTKSGWTINKISFPTINKYGEIYYRDLKKEIITKINRNSEFDNFDLIKELNTELIFYNLNQFPGEFYRRPFLIIENL